MIGMVAGATLETPRLLVDALRGTPRSVRLEPAPGDATARDSARAAARNAAQGPLPATPAPPARGTLGPQTSRPASTSAAGAGVDRSPGPAAGRAEPDSSPPPTESPEALPADPPRDGVLEAHASTPTSDGPSGEDDPDDGDAALAPRALGPIASEIEPTEPPERTRTPPDPTDARPDTTAAIDAVQLPIPKPALAQVAAPRPKPTRVVRGERPEPGVRGETPEPGVRGERPEPDALGEASDPDALDEVMSRLRGDLDAEGGDEPVPGPTEGTRDAEPDGDVGAEEGRVVQVSATPSREGADRLMSELRDEGFAAYVVQSAGTSGRTLYRVRVRPDEDDPGGETADRLASRLGAAGYATLVLTE